MSVPLVDVCVGGCVCIYAVSAFLVSHWYVPQQFIPHILKLSQIYRCLDDMFMSNIFCFICESLSLSWVIRRRVLGAGLANLVSSVQLQ